MQRFSCLFAHTPGACGGTPAPGRAVPGLSRGLPGRLPEGLPQRLLRRCSGGLPECPGAPWAAAVRSCQVQLSGTAAGQGLVRTATSPVPGTPARVPGFLYVSTFAMCSVNMCLLPAFWPGKARRRTYSPPERIATGRGRVPICSQDNGAWRWALAGIGWHQSLPGRSDGRVAVPWGFTGSPA